MHLMVFCSFMLGHFSGSNFTKTTVLFGSLVWFWHRILIFELSIDANAFDGLLKWFYSLKNKSQKSVSFFRWPVLFHCYVRALDWKMLEWTIKKFFFTPLTTFISNGDNKANGITMVISTKIKEFLLKNFLKNKNSLFFP